MAVIKPFKAIRPRKDLAQRVASRPYDVLNALEAREEAKDNPYSFYHISKSEIDFPEDTDSHDEAIYYKAAQNLQQFLKEGVLFQEAEPCYYIYTLIMNDHVQTGLVCVSSVDDYDNDIIKKHEFTRPDKELDRINHMKASQAQTGNVFLAYNNLPLMDALTEQWKMTHDPEYDFTASDGIRHIVWIVDNIAAIAQITKLFDEQVPFTYIADGHHRAAAASLMRKAIRKTINNLSEDSPVNYFLTTIFPANQLKIMDYNRVIKGLNGFTPDGLLEALQKDFEITNKGKHPYRPEALHDFSMYLNGAWYKITVRPHAYREDPIGILDVTILQENVLGKLLGIPDPRTSDRIDFVGGIRGLETLAERVESGEMQVAFALYPVTIQQLFDIADSGNVMPPKSTWFEPKLRDGLLTHSVQ
jgi:uncharacterized protein (DUF1015 family)